MIQRDEVNSRLITLLLSLNKMMKYFLCLLLSALSVSAKGNSKMPKIVNVGAILSFDSHIGRAAKIAIELAVKDVNANSSILPGTKLVVSIHDSNCSGFIGMVEALHYMESEVMAIIGPQSSVVAHVILHAANELQVPLVSFGATDPTLTSIQFPFFLRAVHSDFYQMAAVADVIDYFSWKLVIAIYIDNDFGRNGVSALSQALANNGGKISDKFGIPDIGVSATNVMDYLVKVALLESRVIVLHVYPEMGLRILAAAKYLGMMGNGYVWIATDWLSTVLDSSSVYSSNALLSDETIDTLQGVICFRQHTPASKANKAFKSRWNNLINGSVGMNEYGAYAYDSVWLIARGIDRFFASGGTLSFSRDSRLNELRLGRFSIFDNGKLLLSHIKQQQFTGLTGSFRFNSDGDLVDPAYDVINVIGTGFRVVGYWSNSSGLSITAPEFFTRNSTKRDQNLNAIIWPGDSLSLPRGWVFPNNGKQLRIGVPVRVSFREFVLRVPGTDTFKGFSIDVFLAAVNLLPYAVPYQFIPQGNGKVNPSYTGIVNKILTGELDAVVGDVAIVTNRTKVVDFTQPYAASGLVVVAPFKRLNSGSWAFLRPFSMSLWIVTVSFFLVVGIVVWILEHRINDEFRGPPRKQIITVIWFSLSTMFFAHRENTVSTLGRMVLIIWLFVVLIINSSYTASLTSILTVQQLSSPIKGIETLRESNEPIGFQVGSFAESYLKTELGIEKSRLVALGSPEAYAAALLKGPLNGGVAAIVDERPYMELFLSTHCSFRIVGQEFTKSGWGFAFPRDSPLAVDFSTAILRLSENGDLQRIHDKWLTGSPCASDSGEIDSNRLYLKSFWGLFLICGVTFFLALLIYIFQIFRQMHKTAPQVGTALESGSGRARRLQRLLSLMDEKKESSERGSKRRKTERSMTCNGSGPPSV